MGKERRRYVRLGTDRTVDCSIEGMDVVHVVGLGAEGGGMRVITNRDLPEDEFALELDPNDGQPAMQLTGRVVWHESWDFEICNRVVSGVAFSEMTDNCRARLAALVQEGTGEPDHDEL